MDSKQGPRNPGPLHRTTAAVHVLEHERRRRGGGPQSCALHVSTSKTVVVAPATDYAVQGPAVQYRLQEIGPHIAPRSVVWAMHRMAGLGHRISLAWLT